MNTHSLISRAALVALALGTAGVTAAFADTASPATTGTTTPPAGGWHHHHHGAQVLTRTEWQELKKDRQAVFAANASLKAQADGLKQQAETLKSQSGGATSAQWQALHTQKEALRTQVRAAEQNLDPGAAALFAKIDAARVQHHHSN